VGRRDFSSNHKNSQQAVDCNRLDRHMEKKKKKKKVKRNKRKLTEQGKRYERICQKGVIMLEG